MNGKMIRICNKFLSGCILVSGCTLFLMCGFLPGPASAQTAMAQAGYYPAMSPQENAALTDSADALTDSADALTDSADALADSAGALADSAGALADSAGVMAELPADRTNSKDVTAKMGSDGTSLLQPAAVRKPEDRQVVRTGVDLLTGNSGNTVRVHMSFGYELTHRFTAGAGIGFVPYRDPGNLIPVFLDLVYLMRDGSVSPYIQLKMGRSFLMNTGPNKIEADRYGGGWIINPGMGLQIRSEEAQGLYITAGYNLDHSYLENDEFGGRVVRDSFTWRRMSLGFGFILP